ncbi:sensor histidine kinase [Glutamicibacter sp. MNS18]|uniref:sensor histidine kinase n=1 Tax=Glutamicibacter sp. MNS18 TaxID=2989817 RepID=UPI00223619E7|nr:sensor histidine kinase [Glutamicibacter sp. MNS18]MCW4467048.1 sensor histidine kinase [Glutamicibacter sp. MNS18]
MSPAASAPAARSPEAAHPPIRREKLISARLLQLGQHGITLVLLVFAVLRALVVDPGHGVLVLGVGILLAGWYVLGLPLMIRGGAPRRVLGWLAVLLALWVAALVVSAEFMWLAFSLWLLVGHLLGLGLSVLLSVLIYALAIVLPFVVYGNISYAGVLGPLVGGSFAWGISRGYLQLLHDVQERNTLVASLRQAHREMAALQEELARSQHEAGMLAERTRVARDIHDTIAQQLAAISLHARAAGGTHSGPDSDSRQDARALEQVGELAGQALSDLRRIIAALAPAELEDQALAGALGRMLQRLERQSGIRTELRAAAGLPVLGSTVQVALLRTAQSALANVQQHSRAGRLVLSLQDAGDTVRMDIVDDGVGFDTASWQAGLGHRETDGGFGLQAMGQRLRELGGGLEVESSPGAGTALSAYLPLSAQKGR